MRRYGSFLVRWWLAGPEERRLRIRHVQSDEELTVEALAGALAWMAARIGNVGRDPTVAVTEGEETVERPPIDPTGRATAREAHRALLGNP